MRAFALAALLLPAVAARPNILFLMADQMRFDALGAAGSAANTSNLDALAAEGVRFANAYSSTPSCTPARAAVLTGLSPWYHGMLGYGDIAERYPYELPRAMSEGGYLTAAIGKNHFNWNASCTCANVSCNCGIAHGYMDTLLYDGLGSGLANDTSDEFDNYDRWFAQATNGSDPLATGAPLMDWNSWRGAPYVYPEALHPTAWTGQRAVEWIDAYAASPRASPFFLKVSFHRCVCVCV